MDPLTAFSLAAGILQVVDFSFQALRKCRELYKDGSLAGNKNAKEVAQYLGKCLLKNTKLSSLTRRYR